MNPKKILLVESDVSLAKRASQHLEAESYQVVMALEGPGTFDLVRREKPDLLILDFPTALSRDPSLLERISSIPELRSIPTLILYTHIEEGMVDQLFKYGVRHLLKKPYDLDELSLQVALIFKAKEEESSGNKK
ncbi:MAG: response regulator [candidate division Zixibacteria bacterium]|nr:response regulator [candidate division Zixibacteria bacterium]